MGKNSFPSIILLCKRMNLVTFHMCVYLWNFELHFSGQYWFLDHFFFSLNILNVQIWSLWHLLKTLIPLAGSYLVCVCLAVFNFNVIGQVSLRDTTCALNIYLFNCSALFVKRKTLHIQGASEVRAYYVSVLGFC